MSGVQDNGRASRLQSSADDPSFFNPHQLVAPRGARPDMHSGFAAFEVLSYQCDQLGIGFAVHRRSLYLCLPRAVIGLNKRCDAGVWLDLDAKGYCCHVSLV